MLHSIKHLRPAMEAIHFQSGAAFKELKMLLEPFCGQRDAPTKGRLAELAAKLDDVAARHIGINAAIEFSYSGSCMFPPDISNHNPILADWRSFFSSTDGMKMISKSAADEVIGVVDLKKSKLTGFLAKMPVRINLDIHHFTTHNFTGGEIAAVLLHEIGHYFTYCELLTRTVMTNQVLAGLERVMREGDTQQYQIALKKTVEVLEIDRVVIEQLSKSTDEKVVITLLTTEVTNKLRSENKYSIYDQVTWEMMSDQFATRHGAGRELATALEKMFKAYGVQFITNKTLHCIIQAGKVAFKLLMIAASVFVISGGAFFAGTLMLLCNLLSVVGSVDFDIAGTYDKPAQRFVRIKNQLIEYSKDQHLSKDAALKVIDDIDAIDQAIRATTEHEDWFSIVTRKLIAPIGRRYDNVRFQQQLENLAANSLFTHSLELKHI